MRFLLSAVLLSTFCALAQAQPKAATGPASGDKRRLEFIIKGAEKDSIFLASYYGNKLYYSDTSVSDGRGRVVFERAQGYKAGVYAVVVPGPKYFEILVNETQVVMETDTIDLGGHVVVKKSLENQLFLDYVRFINEKRKAADAVNKEREATEDPIKKAALKEKLVEYESAIKNYQKDLVAKNPGMFVAMIVKMSMSPEQVDIKKPDGTLDSAATYYHYRNHFWDNTDLTDERILRTPVFQNKFEEYISKVVPQIPDTINKCADELIHRMDHGDELFKFAVHNITYKYETSDIMGMDAVFVHMAQTYYCPINGKPNRATWLSGEKLDKLCERARKQAPLIIGAQAKNIILPDTTESNWQNMYKLAQEYVLVIFWDPHCGHCKKTLPDIYAQYKEKLRPLDVEVFAVAKATDSTLFADWKAFIRENKLDWVNAGLTWHMYVDAKQNPNKYIPKFTTLESLNYADAWDVYSTPKFFLLDADRKIVGKQLTPDQMVDLIANLRKRKGLPPLVPKSKALTGSTEPRPDGKDGNDMSFSQESKLDSTERIIVLGLDGKSCDNASQDKQAMADVLAEKLMNKYDIIERTQLDAVLKEHKFQMSGLVDERSAIQAGSIAGAEGVVVCRASCLDGKNLYTAKLIDCRSGKQIWAGSGSNASFNQFTSEISRRIAPTGKAR